jgi:hypothetical protein
MLTRKVTVAAAVGPGRALRAAQETQKRAPPGGGARFCIQEPVC